MNAKNLPLKFTFVALLVAICLYALYAEGLTYGIDLQGGHSLIFEILTPKKELDRLNADLARQKELLAKAVTDEQKQAIQGKIKGIEGDIAHHRESLGGEQNLAEQMIEILKDRIDPKGLASLEWRPVGANRIEVRMPAAFSSMRSDGCRLMAQLISGAEQANRMQIRSSARETKQSRVKELPPSRQASFASPFSRSNTRR